MWFSKMYQKFVKFLKESWGEFKRVTWPSKKELISSTTVVILFVLFFAIFIGIIDLLLTQIFTIFIK